MFQTDRVELGDVFDIGNLTLGRFRPELGYWRRSAPVDTALTAPPSAATSGAGQEPPRRAAVRAVRGSVLSEAHRRGRCGGHCWGG